MKYKVGRKNSLVRACCPRRHFVAGENGKCRSVALRFGTLGLQPAGSPSGWRGAGPEPARPARATPPRLERRLHSFEPWSRRREHAMSANAAPSAATPRARSRSRAKPRASYVTGPLCCYVPTIRTWTSALPFVPEALSARFSPRTTTDCGFCVTIRVGCLKISGEWESRAAVRLRLVWPHYFRNTYAAIRSSVLEPSKHYKNTLRMWYYLINDVIVNIAKMFSNFH